MNFLPSSNQTTDQRGQPYHELLIAGVLRDVVPELAPSCTGITTGSRELEHKVFFENKNGTYEGRTGRRRGQCSPTQLSNHRFQGLVADGFKLALFDLVMKKYRVVNFMHDAFLIELPLSEAISDDVLAIEKIITEALTSVMPDMKPRLRSVLMDRWYADAKPTFDDNGKLTVFTQFGPWSQMRGAA
jgi:hypothetical protein